jgi:hypothetical protein
VEVDPQAGKGVGVKDGSIEGVKIFKIHPLPARAIKA